MSQWELIAFVGGFAKGKGGDDGAINTEEATALSASLDAPPIWH